MRTRKEIEDEINNLDFRTVEGGAAMILAYQTEILLDIRALLSDKRRIL